MSSKGNAQAVFCGLLISRAAVIQSLASCSVESSD
jgi:hypothetical protein